jgi:hypothetical protein
MPSSMPKCCNGMPNMPIVCQIAEKISVKHNKKANHRTQNPVVLFLYAKLPLLNAYISIEKSCSLF